MASGDPFTTLGNTFRSLIYCACYSEGFDYEAAAAGDDGIIFTTREHASQIRDQMLSLTARDRIGSSPLGQVIKEVVLTEDWNRVDFCSKWFYHVGDRLEASRDYRKLLATK